MSLTTVTTLTEQWHRRACAETSKLRETNRTWKRTRRERSQRTSMKSHSTAPVRIERWGRERETTVDSHGKSADNLKRRENLESKTRRMKKKRTTRSGEIPALISSSTRSFTKDQSNDELVVQQCPMSSHSISTISRFPLDPLWHFDPNRKCRTLNEFDRPDQTRRSRRKLTGRHRHAHVQRNALHRSGKSRWEIARRSCRWSAYALGKMNFTCGAARATRYILNASSQLVLGKGNSFD